MPKYSNLKLKPQVQADVVLFKAKENILTQEQKALNNLNAMLKQNIITPELNEVLTKEVNSKNKNVVKYLSNINLEKNENLKGHKAIAQRLVDNHAQISGAIASLKSVDDETKEKLDFENQQKMVHGINEIYTKDKDVEKTEETNGEIGFGGRKDRAMKIVKKRTAAAAAIAAGTSALNFVPTGGPLLSLSTSIAGLMANEYAMVQEIASEYGITFQKSDEDGDHIAASGTKIGLPSATGGTLTINALLNKAAEELTKEAAKQALLNFIPFVGPIVSTGVASTTTYKLGERVIKVYQQETNHYD